MEKEKNGAPDAARDLKFSRAFTQLREVGSVALHALKNHFGSFETAWSAREEILKNAGIPPRATEAIVAKRSSIDPDRAMEKLAKENIWMITETSQEYPALLKEISHAPYVLYGQGDRSLLDIGQKSRHAIGVVGTRRPTSYGIEVAETITGQLASAGIIIVSGLATGIDTRAHSATLDNNGKTIAVLGSGIDRASLFPRENVRLADAIVESGGLILSEHPPGTPAFKEHFPQRNRIISGLARGILVVEAREKSGALITARFALEQNRDVFAIPGSVLSPVSFGANRLIQEGAKLVTSARDILEEWGMTEPEYIQANAISGIAEKDLALLSILEDAMSVGEIKAKTGLETRAIIASLSLLELKGAVRNMGGDTYQKINE